MISNQPAVLNTVASIGQHPLAIKTNVGQVAGIVSCQLNHWVHNRQGLYVNVGQVTSNNHVAVDVGIGVDGYVLLSSECAFNYCIC